MGRISTSSRYVIDMLGTYPLSLGEISSAFGEFGASGRARRMKIGRRVRDLNKLTLYQLFSGFDHLGAGGRGKNEKNEVFLTYAYVIAS